MDEIEKKYLRRLDLRVEMQGNILNIILESLQLLLLEI
jgi:hypothetical protein